jgi:hypothetical protein
MEIVFLSNEERSKFSQWLEQEASSNDMLATQADKLKLPIARMLRSEAAACIIIARKLKNTESQSKTYSRS